MAVIHTADAYAVEQVPIEQIELGDRIVTVTADGEPRHWQVHAKRFTYNRAAGEPPRIALQAEPEPGATHVASCEATVGTLVHRIIPAPPQQEDATNAFPEVTDIDTTAAPDPNYRHPKCYANTRGGCSTKVSGEHFISHSLIKLYGFDDPTLTIKHDSGYGVREFVKPSKFVANILCEKHNNDLHVADDAALAFAKFMRTISLRYQNGSGEWGDYEEITISGDDFQAWVLKLILNHVVGKAFIHQKGEFVSPFPPEAVDVLLGRAMWPRNWGLCVAGDASNTDCASSIGKSHTMSRDRSTTASQSALQLSGKPHSNLCRFPSLYGLHLDGQCLVRAWHVHHQVDSRISGQSGTVDLMLEQLVLQPTTHRQHR